MVAYLFPGQGTQYVGMGKDLYEAFACSRRIFEEADAALGFSISELCFNGPQEKLTATENAQPAIVTVSIAALEALKEQRKNAPSSPVAEPEFTAGLSLGEYSALVAAGALQFKDAVCLVRKRGQYMEEAARNNPGKMLSIIGLTQEVVRGLCKETQCEIANLNCPGQVVISGKIEQIEKAKTRASREGAKRAILLDVSGAFHSSLMKDAEVKLAAHIRTVAFAHTTVPVVSNVTAQGASDPETLIQNLITQVSSSTYWERSIRYMVHAGVDRFLEIGSGTVLKGLNRRIVPDATTVTLGNAEQITAFVGQGVN